MSKNDAEEKVSRTVVKSADRALDVIEHITSSIMPPTFSEIARALDLPKSSLSQLLSNLVSRGYVEIDQPSATYRPGVGLLSLVSRAATAIPLRVLVNPVLERLRDEINETASYYVRSGDEVTLIESVASRQSLIYIINAGERAPMYAISAGKVLLAHADDDDFEGWLRRTPRKKFTSATVTAADKLRKEMVQIRQEGFAYSHGEYSQGIEGIAYPVRVGGRVIGAVNTSIPTVRYNEKLRRSAERALTIAATQIEHVLAAREASAARGR